jgi:hypothetical protein
MSAAALLAAASLSAAAQTVVDDNRYCAVEGFDRPLRQTIVILDEHHVEPEEAGRQSQANEPWRRFIGQLLDVGSPAIENRFLPRERVTLAVAAADGSGMQVVYRTCLAFFSDQERRGIESSDGLRSHFNTFFGTGVVAEAANHAQRARPQLASALARVGAGATASDARVQSSRLAESALVSSLSRGSFFNVSDGVPRIVLYSDLARFAAPEDAADPRRAGVEDAADLDVSFHRAEVYVTGVEGFSGGEDGRRYAEAFFLQLQGRVVSMTRAASIPQFSLPPVSVATYQGRVAYPGFSPPMRMRLALDTNGTAVNSWVGVQTDSERATPFSGVMTCVTDDECEFIGDRVFAQIWAGGASEPRFESWIPFSGLREFEFRVRDDRINGRAFDSLVELEGMAGDALEFDLVRLEGGAY